MSNDISKDKKVANVPNLRFKQFSNEWLSSRLKDESYPLKYGLGASAIPFNGQQRYIRITDISSELSNSEFAFVSPSFFDSEFLLEKNDILLARTGATVGSSYIYKDDSVKTYFAGFLIRVRAKNIDPSFLFYQLSTSNYFKWVKTMSARSGQPGINSSEYGSYRIWLCGKEEQQDLGSFLTLIDDRIQVQNKIIKDKKELKKGICEKKINNLQTELSLNDLIKKGYARTIKPSELLPFTGQKEYLSTSSINNNGISQVECKITYENRPSRACMFPMKNSVWFAKMKNTVKVFKSTDDDDEKYVLSTGFYGLLCEETKMNADWLYHLFKTNYFNDQKDRFSEGSSMSGIKDNQFNDIKIKIFENKLEEENFLSFLNLIDCSIQVEIRLLELFQNGKKYFLANLFI